MPLATLRPSSLGPALGLLPQVRLRGLRGLPGALCSAGAFAHILNLSKGSSFYTCVQLTDSTPIPLIYCLFT